MKKTFALLAALALAAAGPSFAQTAVKTTGTNANQNALHQNLSTKATGKGGTNGGKHDKSPTQKADQKAGKMAKQLGLNADQEVKVEALLLAREQESTALKAKYGADKKAGRPALKAAHDRYEAQLKTILTPEQFAKLDMMKAEHHNHGKDGSKMKGKAKA